MSNSHPHIADAPPQNWVDRYAPDALRPFMHLARWDRPIGSWLLLWPCWWSIGLAAAQGHGLQVGPVILPDPWLLLLFGIGAIAMRGAGCTYNDIVDRNYDGRVERTKLRPIPSGAVSQGAAWAFLIAQCLAGLVVLLQLNQLTILLGALSLLPVAIYPFMKRITYWPQAMLGITFNWGAMMGWTAASGTLPSAALVLYGGAMAWTIGYDTIYAHQDKEDDALIGLKSTALKFGEQTKPWLWLFYGIMAGALVATGLMIDIGWGYYVGIAGAVLHLAQQIRRVDIHNGATCLAVFRSNRQFGWIVFAAILAGCLTTPV